MSSNTAECDAGTWKRRFPDPSEKTCAVAGKLGSMFWEGGRVVHVVAYGYVYGEWANGAGVAE